MAACSSLTLEPVIWFRPGTSDEIAHLDQDESKESVDSLSLSLPLSPSLSRVQLLTNELTKVRIIVGKSVFLYGW